MMFPEMIPHWVVLQLILGIYEVLIETQAHRTLRLSYVLTLVAIFLTDATWQFVHNIFLCKSPVKPELHAWHL